MVRKRGMGIVVAALIFGIISILGGPVMAAQEIGMVKTAKGKVHIERGKQIIPVSPGTMLLESDVLVTLEDGAMGIIFKDNSVLSLGEETRIALTEYEFDPAVSRVGFIADMLKGTMTYLTGIIGHLNPESVEIRTPSAIIGIRGTHLAIKVDK